MEIKSTTGQGGITIVTDGSTTVTSATQLTFSGATVSNGGGGNAIVTITTTAPAIGGTLTGATAGSVLFAGSGTFAQDNSNFFYDNTNKRLGIGSTTTSAYTSRLLLYASSASADDSNIAFDGPAFASGTHYRGFGVYDGGVQIGGFNYKYAAGAKTFEFGTIASNRIDIYTNSSVRMSVDGSGSVGINTTSTGSKFNVNGNVSIGASYVGTAAPTNGAIIQGNAGIGTSTPGSQLVVKQAATFNATGTVTSSGNTLTGTGTAFFTELDIGASVTPSVGGITRTITAVTSNTSATYNGASGSIGSGTLSVIPAILNIYKSDGTNYFSMANNGTINLFNQNSIVGITGGACSFSSNIACRINNVSITSSSIVGSLGNGTTLHLQNTNAVGFTVTPISTSSSSVAQVLFALPTPASGEPLSVWQRNSVEIMRLDTAGNLGVRQATPTAYLHLGAGTATAGTAPLKQSTGTLLTALESGTYEFDGNNHSATCGTLRGTIPRVLFTQTADKTVTNTVTETSIIGTGVATGGGMTLAANALIAGRTLRLRIGGVYSTPAISTPSLIIKVKLGSVVIATVTTSGLLSGASSLEFDGEVLLTCRTTGGSGTVMVHGDIEYSTGVAGTISVDSLNNAGATTTIDTTISNLLDVTVQWDSATSTRIAKSTVTTLEVLN